MHEVQARVAIGSFVAQTNIGRRRQRDQQSGDRDGYLASVIRDPS